MAESEIINLTVQIAGKNYPLKVKKHEETAIQAIVDDVNNRIKEYQETYPKRDKQEWLSMSLLSFAIEKYQVEKTLTDAKLMQKIDNLDKLIEEIISN